MHTQRGQIEAVYCVWGTEAPNAGQAISEIAAITSLEPATCRILDLRVCDEPVSKYVYTLYVLYVQTHPPLSGVFK